MTPHPPPRKRSKTLKVFEGVFRWGCSDCTWLASTPAPYAGEKLQQALIEFERHRCDDYANLRQAEEQ